MFLLDYKIILTKLLFTFFNLNLICCNKYYYKSCYDKDNGPRKCNPDFVNAAYNLKATATNTCGKLISYFTDYYFNSYLLKAYYR